MQLRRYSLILRRWSWLLAIGIGSAALLSWLSVTRQGGYSLDGWLVVVLVTLGGLVWGLAGIFGIEYLIDNVKTIDEVRDITASPLLGVVEVEASSEKNPFVVLRATQSDTADAYRAATLNIPKVDNQSQGQGRVVLLSSPQATPHTAQVAANLAVSAALSGMPTLLIDANSTEADLSKSLDLTGQPGFAEALADLSGEITLHLVPSVPNLYVLPAGRIPVGESIAFTSAYLHYVINRSGAHASLVVISGPAINGHVHGLGPGLARAADEVVVLVVPDETKRKALRRTIASLAEVGANLVGVIIAQPRKGIMQYQAAQEGAAPLGAGLEPNLTGTGAPFEPLAQPRSARSEAIHEEDRGLLAVGAKWLAVARVWARSLGRADKVAQPRDQAPTVRQGISLTERAQLTGARVVRAFTTRRASTQRDSKDVPVAGNRYSTGPLSSRYNTGPLSEDIEERQDWAGSLLKTAEKAHRRGNTADAKVLVQRVLDRDPRNEAAWQLRLSFSEPPPVAQTHTEAQPAPATPTRSSSGLAVGLLALLVLAAAGVGGYFGWQMLAGKPGQQSATPAPSLASPAPSPSGELAVEPGRTFTETGYVVSEPFLSFWEKHNGEVVFGYPISERITEQGKNGQQLTVQYFDHARMELQDPGNGQPQQVTLGLLGLEVPVRGTVANPLPEGLQGEQVPFPGTDFSVPRKFYDFWVRNGGIEIFGNPITPVLNDTTSERKQLAVQYFERARFEYHPEYTGSPNEVALTHLGVQVHQK